MNIVGDPSYPRGDGGFEDFTNGTPLPSNFYGMPGWWSVPTSWYTQTVSGQIFVSPNSDFSKPYYAVKINQDGTWVFQDMWRRTLQIAAARGESVNIQPSGNNPTLVVEKEVLPDAIDGGDPAGDNFTGGLTGISGGAP